MEKEKEIGTLGDLVNGKGNSKDPKTTKAGNKPENDQIRDQRFEPPKAVIRRAPRVPDPAILNRIEEEFTIQAGRLSEDMHDAVRTRQLLQSRQKGQAALLHGQDLADTHEVIEVMLQENQGAYRIIAHEAYTNAMINQCRPYQWSIESMLQDLTIKGYLEDVTDKKESRGEKKVVGIYGKDYAIAPEFARTPGANHNMDNLFQLFDETKKKERFEEEKKKNKLELWKKKVEENPLSLSELTGGKVGNIILPVPERQVEKASGEKETYKAGDILVESVEVDGEVHVRILEGADGSERIANSLAETGCWISPKDINKNTAPRNSDFSPGVSKAAYIMYKILYAGFQEARRLAQEIRNKSAASAKAKKEVKKTARKAS